MVSAYTKVNVMKTSRRLPCAERDWENDFDESGKCVLKGVCSSSLSLTIAAYDVILRSQVFTLPHPANSRGERRGKRGWVREGECARGRSAEMCTYTHARMCG